MSRKNTAASRRRGQLEADLAEQTSHVPVQPGDGQARARWRTLVLQALLSAVLLALAAPPMDLWPLALVALVPLLLGLRDATPVRALAPAWLCGFVINLIGFRWGYALLDRFGHLPAWARVLALLALAAYQASVFSLWAGLGNLLTRSARVPWLVALPLSVAVAESVLPFLFPWNLAVTVWRAWPLLQVAELGGAPAVSALVVLINLTLLEAGLALRHGRPLPRPVRVACGVVLAVVAAGLLRATHVALARQAAPEVRVGIVQPNSGTITAEERKHRGEQYLAPLRQATLELARGGAELVVWPESAFPFLFDRRQRRVPGAPPTRSSARERLYRQVVWVAPAPGPASPRRGLRQGPDAQSAALTHTSFASQASVGEVEDVTFGMKVLSSARVG